MFENISTFITEFMQGGRDRAILVLLVLMISVFLVITLILFCVTVYLRISNSIKDVRNRYRSKKWDPIFLSVMDGSVSAKSAFENMPWKNSTSYLLYLELYIDMVKGQEKERLLALGRLSINKLQALLSDRSRKNRLYGVHLLGLFNPKDQSQYLRFEEKDFEMTLTMIREMRTIDDFRVKERLISLLFLFKYISPVYLSNILVDMGEEIIPILKMLVVERREHPYEQIVALETVRRLHYTGCLELTERILKENDHPLVLTSCLKYIGEMGDESHLKLVRPFTSHPSSQVRLAAVDASLSLSDEISNEEIKQYFNDPVIQIAVSAAKKMNLMSTVPFFELEEIEQFKWADIYKRMVY